MPYYSSTATLTTWQDSSNNTGGTVDPWGSWTTGTSSASVETVWINWVMPNGTQFTIPAYRTNPVPVSDAERERAAREIEERQREWELAQERAEHLLAETLSDPQRRDLREHDYFDVRGSRGGVYRICRGQVRNVLALVDGQPLNRLCAHPQRERVPDADAMLAQALMLQTDEAGFASVANVERY